MNKLTSIIHTNIQQKMANLLHTIDQLPNFIFSHMEGHRAEVVFTKFREKENNIVAQDSHWVTAVAKRGQLL